MEKKKILNIVLGISTLIGCGYGVYRLVKINKNEEKVHFNKLENDNDELQDFTNVKRSYILLPKNNKVNECTEKAM